jgi:hypothetical protein
MVLEPEAEVLVVTAATEVSKIASAAFGAAVFAAPMAATGL